MNTISARNHGDRRADELRVFRRRTSRFPFYVQKHPGKTPGKVCSCEMCGNPRRFFGVVTRQEMAAQIDEMQQPEKEPVESDFADDSYDTDDDLEFDIARNQEPLAAPFIDVARFHWRNK